MFSTIHRKAGLSVVCLALLAGLLLAGCLPAAYKFRGVPYPRPKPAAALPLTDQAGRPFALADQRGKVLAVYFGYTFCPDVCPLTLAQLTQVWRELTPEEAARFQPIFVTVDPERDTGEVLARYLAVFDNAVGSDRGLGFIGLHGAADALAVALEGYGAQAIKRLHPGSAAGYSMDHTASIFVVDPNGNLVEWFPYGAAEEDIVADVRHLIQHRSSP
jgi:protein SCO1/2